MRSWLADRLDAFSYWLEDRSRDIGGMAWRLRPHRKGVSGITSEILTATLRANAHKLADNVTQNNALLARLKSQASTKA